MPVIGLQGVQGGSGTTSVTAALAWALQQLGESVLVIDATPDNMLRLFFDIKISHHEGWARAALDGQEWQQSGWRYTPYLDILPFGTLTQAETEQHYATATLCDAFNLQLTMLKQSQQYQWILIDLPAWFPGLPQALLKNVEHHIMIAQPNSNGLLRVSQHPAESQRYLLVNALQTNSQLQNDIHQVWLHTQPQMIPVTFHADEAMAESFAVKKPAGEHMPHALAAEEATTLANWCLINLADQHS